MLVQLIMLMIVMLILLMLLNADDNSDDTFQCMKVLHDSKWQQEDEEVEQKLDYKAVLLGEDRVLDAF